MQGDPKVDELLAPFRRLLDQVYSGERPPERTQIWNKAYGVVFGLVREIDSYASTQKACDARAAELRARTAVLEQEACRFYRADGTYEVLPPATVVERRVLAARRLADLEARVRELEAALVEGAEAAARLMAEVGARLENAPAPEGIPS